ncbi:hypothetical protein Fmac_022902 [Flemingia macrophylla]|uniref:C2H2-type domain-containing protein n=1 Tax=Flemingia macrophylla TaxID=520843 RepID=A0ABD1LK00_9FABA
MALSSSNTTNNNNININNIISTSLSLSPLTQEKGTGQLGLSQRVTEWRKTSLVAKKTMRDQCHGLVQDVKPQFSPPSLHKAGLDADTLIRKSQMLRAQLMMQPLPSTSILNRQTQQKSIAREMLQAEPTSLDMAARTGLSIAPAPQIQNPFFKGFSLPDLNKNAVRVGSGDTRVAKADSCSESSNDVRRKGKGHGNCDAHIHSFPYKKNGPYTCPRCKIAFHTSQKFAAHVSASHYRFETKSERQKRLMAKVRGRNLRLKRVNDTLTLVPAVDDVGVGVDAGNNNNNNVVVTPPPRVKVEFDAKIVPPPPQSVGGVNIKLEPVDT